MNKFWDYSANLAADGFGRFSPGHLLWLMAGAGFIALGCRLYRRQRRRRRAARITALACLSLELLRAGVLLWQGLYDTGRLPLHLCTISIYLCFLHSICPWRLLGQFLYAFSLPGAAFALLFPDWAGYPVWHFVTLSSFLLHFLLVLYPLMLSLTGEIRPEPAMLPGCLMLMLCLSVPIYFINKLLDTNYMFLNWPPAGTPLAIFAGLGSPGYLLVCLPLAAAVWLLLYRPWKS